MRAGASACVLETLAAQVILPKIIKEDRRHRRRRLEAASKCAICGQYRKERIAIIHVIL